MSHGRPKPFIDHAILQIRTTGLCQYEAREWLIPYSRQKPSGEETPVSQVEAFTTKEGKKVAAYSGEMTDGSRKRLRNAINLLIHLAHWKRVAAPGTGVEFDFLINFITLTLPAPQGHITDSTIRKEALEPFIRRMRDHYGMKKYIWKAERQLNGNIHYHITTDVFILFSDIQNEWNHQLAKLGFIDQFQAKHGHRHPNSTDVHSVQKIKNLASYLVKYMAKSGKPFIKEAKDVKTAPFRRWKMNPKHFEKTCKYIAADLPPIDGKMWDCSLQLKQPCKIEFELGSEEEELINRVTKQFPHSHKPKTKAIFNFLNRDEMTQALTSKFKSAWDQRLAELRDYERTKSVIYEPPPPEAQAPF